MTGAATTHRTPAQLALGSVMLAFDGLTVPADIAQRLAAAAAAGVTLFRFSNVASPGQVRELTAELQRAAGPSDPLLIAADQEGGQLNALGEGVTPFAGNMALGAAADPALTERVARATGVELRAMGVTVDYAPAADLATNPRNAAVGIRSFGDDPSRVGDHVAAFVRGLQAAGVAAGIKHFPGLGAVTDDTHHGLAVSEAGLQRLHSHELVPFRMGLAAGARVVMSAHIALPGVTGDRTVPATLARSVMTDLLRNQLGFEGVSITDALDMRAIAQGDGQVGAILAALAAGVDLLLTAPDPVARERIERGLAEAASGGRLDMDHARRSRARHRDLIAWLSAFEQPALERVGAADHLALAAELAARSITLVRNDGSLPLRLDPGARILAVMPAPTDQTPADTSSTVAPGLAAALRRIHPAVDEIVVAHAPGKPEIAAVRDRAAGSDLVVVGTTAAILEPAQAALVAAILETRTPVVSVALRTPFDLATYPTSTTHVSTYGILRPQLDALANGLFGIAPFGGRLPAAIPGLHPTGHGLSR